MRATATSRQEYLERINRVLDYIDVHLEEKLALAALAKVAAFSPFHFHRVFRAIRSETVSEYVNRLRLERAAFKLTYSPAIPVTTIALDCGFSTSANFARAFKLHFGRSATAYRKEQERKVSQTNRKTREAPSNWTRPPFASPRRQPRPARRGTRCASTSCSPVTATWTRGAGSWSSPTVRSPRTTSTGCCVESTPLRLTSSSTAATRSS
jgi:AraC-like DNA-binding protein